MNDDDLVHDPRLFDSRSWLVIAGGYQALQVELETKTGAIRPEMTRQIEEAERQGRTPDTFIPLGHETREERRRRERIAAKALKKRNRSLRNRVTSFAP